MTQSPENFLLGMNHVQASAHTLHPKPDYSKTPVPHTLRIPDILVNPVPGAG